MSNFDVIVIGAGPGGYVAAIRAGQLGLKTAIIERENLGGVCLNWGCIPTKALLRSSEIYSHMKHAANYGLSADKFNFDLNAVVQRSRGVAKQLSGGVAMLLKKNKVEVFMGSGSLLGGGKVEFTAEDGKKSTLEGKNIIVATGARARVIPGFEPDGKFVWTYREALVPNEMPKKLLVMGSGAIGIEFANFYHSLGAEVTVVEMIDRIMPFEDEEISTMARKSFEKQGINILTSTKVLGIKKNATDVSISLEDAKGVKSEIVVDKVISAVGVVANIENIGLEKTKIKVENGHIVVDEFLKTAEAGIYAIGDVVPGPWLAHKASHEAVICVEKIAGKNPHPLVRDKIPGCTYSTPQVASVGLTEKKAKELGIELKIGRFPYIGNGKAIALGEPEGLVKTIFNAKTGELLGAHMIGAEVTELIQGYVIAMGLETTEEELMHTIFAHPTLSEMMHESVLQAYGKAIHI
ncbi:MAG: dihydrolipoyl dehydrogenase [Alphaproteobacteria bacterium]|jgi:dihydrolipoamide dehydrogenase|nr:dihydrolipoyl dehydrogenase [Alphaproteobacteria bacterium]